MARVSKDGRVMEVGRRHGKFSKSMETVFGPLGPSKISLPAVSRKMSQSLIRTHRSTAWLDLSNGNNEDGTRVQCWNQDWNTVSQNKNSQWYLITEQEGDASTIR